MGVAGFSPVSNITAVDLLSASTIELSAEKTSFVRGFPLHSKDIRVLLRGASYAAAIATGQPVWRDFEKPQGVELRFVGARLPGSLQDSEALAQAGLILLRRARGLHRNIWQKDP